MYNFPAGLYTDVRIEDVFETQIAVTLGEVEQLKDKRFAAAFVRLFDGQRWFYSATTDVERLQQEIDSLAAMATPNPCIDEDEIVRKFEANRGNAWSLPTTTMCPRSRKRPSTACCPATFP